MDRIWRRQANRADGDLATWIASVALAASIFPVHGAAAAPGPGDEAAVPPPASMPAAPGAFPEGAPADPFAVPESAPVDPFAAPESAPTTKPAAPASGIDTGAAERLEDELAAELGASAEEEGKGAGASASPPSSAALGRILLLPNISAVLTSGLWFFSAVPIPRFPAHEPFHSRSGLRFQIQELELALQASIDPYIRGDIYIALTLEGLEIEEAFLTTLSLPASFQVRAGWFYAVFGRFSAMHFLEVSAFVDMPLVNRRFFGGEQLRGLGFEVSWLAPLPWYLEILIDVTTANNEVSFGVPIAETRGPEDFLTLARVKQFFSISDRWSLTWGLSGAQGPNNSGGVSATADNRTLLLGTDLYLRWRDIETVRSVSLQAEYILRHASVPGALLTEAGVYLHLDARLTRHLELSARFDYHGLPSIVAGDIQFKGELLEYLTPTKEWRIGAAVSLFASEFHRWRLQYNAHKLMDGPDGLVASRDLIHEVFLQYQFVMGSHGAHPF